MARKKRKNSKKTNEKGKKINFFTVPPRTQKIIWGVGMFSIALIVTLSFFGKAGLVGEKFNNLTTFLIGDTVYATPFFLIGIGLASLGPTYKKYLGAISLAIFALILGISGTLASFYPALKKGGWLGYILTSFITKFFGILVAKIISFALTLTGLLIFWQLLISPILKKRVPEKKEEEEKEKEEEGSILTQVFNKVKEFPKFRVKKIPPLHIEEISEPAPQTTPLELKVEKVPKKPLASKYQLPPPDLLAKDQETPSAGDTKTKSTLIKKTLENFSIPVEMAGINIGPTVTQYTLKPAEGIKLSKITTLSNNFSLALAAHPIRIEAPIPGQSLVGIEVPNRVRARVRLRSLISRPEFQNSASDLTFALGKDVSGEPVFANLAQMPHLLVAGATGTGKTIFLNSLILSFLYQNSPETLRFILIDPKRVEFTAYNKLPHLLCPVIYDAAQTVKCLQWLVGEMGERFDILSLERVRDIVSYNEKALREGKEFMPYLVLVIDELADLILAKGKEIETGIVRLAQLARAVGIHLVVATQRPSVEVITGLIKANITSRISFQVASQVDSRTVLDMAGAEKLLGLGDMLYLSAISESLKVTLSETREEGSGLSPRAQEDSLYPEAKRVVIEERRASASLLQRKLRVGYARAARLIDMLEEQGVIGPSRGSKSRRVYIDGQNPKEGDFGSDYDEDMNII